MEQYTPALQLLPMLPLRGLVVLPKTLIHFDVARKKSVAALESALRGDQRIFLVTQKDPRENDPVLTDLHTIGTIAQIKQVLKLPDDGVRVLVEGVSRAELVSVVNGRRLLKAQVIEAPEKKLPVDSPAVVARVRRLKELFGEYADLAPKLAPDIYLEVSAMEDPSEIADFIAANVLLEVSDRQAILDILDPIERADRLAEIIDREIDILAVELDLNEKVRESMDRNQRDYYLREQIKVIQNELGEGDDPRQESEEYAERIRKLKLPDEVSEPLLKEAARLSKMSFGSAEATVSRNYLDTVLELPWNHKTKVQRDIARAERILERDHYGLKKVKERILENLAVDVLKGKTGGSILCLVGPPGVGKTSIAASIARATGRNFARISLGGVRDEAEIRGHRKTYIGSMPGRIINAIKTAKSSNPLLLLDEIDKLASDMRGDPCAALLEVLDAEQNSTFRDHYLEVPFDLSDVQFITTANTLDTVPRPLLDRMDVIELTSYTDLEKLMIAKRHLLPKQMKKHGLTRADLTVGDATLRAIIDGYTRESGVRRLERQLGALCRKAALRRAKGETGALKVTLLNLEELLGPRRYRPERQSARGEVGVANGLAWTAVGGEMLKIEVALLEGTGKLELTGSLGDVMKESAKAALTYIRSRADVFGVEADFYKKKDIHIHVPEGAVPKDGPSAGITMTTAILSALTGVPARGTVAMTGEITLRGCVLPIGGLREKSMAALKNGKKTVIIPADNEPDLTEIDPLVREKLNFIPVSNYDEVLPVAFEKTFIRNTIPLKERGGVAAEISQ